MLAPEGVDRFAGDEESVARRDADADAELGARLRPRQQRADEIVERRAIEREPAVVEGELRAREVPLDRARQCDAADLQPVLAAQREAEPPLAGRHRLGSDREIGVELALAQYAVDAEFFPAAELDAERRIEAHFRLRSPCAPSGATMKRNALPPTERTVPVRRARLGTHASETRNAPSILMRHPETLRADCAPGRRACAPRRRRPSVRRRWRRSMLPSALVPAVEHAHRLVVFGPASRPIFTRGAADEREDAGEMQQRLVRRLACIGLGLQRMLAQSPRSAPSANLSSAFSEP